MRALCRMDAAERSARADTPLHRIDARAKLPATFVYLVTMLSVPLTRLSELLLYLLFPLLCAAAGAIRYGDVVRRSLVVLPPVALIGVFNLFCDRSAAFRIGGLVVTTGALTFLSILLRGLLSMQALLVLIRSTGFYPLCRAMQRLGIPALFTAQLLFVYRYTYILIEEAARMSMARDARSFGRRAYPLRLWGELVGQLLLRTFRRAEAIGRAMAARGFTGRLPEGIRPPGHWQPRDTAFVALWSAGLLLLRLLRPAEHLSVWITH